MPQVSMNEKDYNSVSSTRQSPIQSPGRTRSNVIFYSLFAVACASFLVARMQTPGPSVTVTIGGSTVVGRVYRSSGGANIEFFGGLPYAEPPTLNRRLRSPVLKTALDANRFDARVPGKACIQMNLPESLISEDCLTLNIYRPPGISKDEELPILVWIHGGGFVVGYGSRYDGRGLVARSIERGTPVLVITINYRLGPLGFPQSEAAIEQGALNLGLKDMIAALKWVKLNVRKFGGNPDKVTVFGESAGARAIELLMLNHKVDDLVQGAIIQSAGSVPTVSASSTQRTLAWSSFINETKVCPSSPAEESFGCLRTLRATHLLEAYNNAGISFPTFANWFPNFDGDTVSAFPSQGQVVLGENKNLAVMIGMNLDEATFITPQDISSPEQIRSILNAFFSPSPRGQDAFESAVDHILELYPDSPELGSPFNTGNETFGLDKVYKRYAAIACDLFMTAERRLLLRRLNDAGVKAYSYLFADPDAASVFPPEFIIQPPAPGSLGVPHASEIAYIFGTLSAENRTGIVSSTAADLSRDMMDYWLSFANSLDPNDGKGSERPYWPAYHAASRPLIMQLKGSDTRAIEDSFREEQIAFFNEDPVLYGR
ncbi:extracellular triacylglycerol lipase precursor [Moniliophthora roreri MCA 2997]|uniref:Carboxylic ester hydrolase n=2 Tax=Moniliophthora roreri TaxID=221103 RepID=V2X2J7_MONRO|nr:extracellular triacylglycerol lipase precursor [Moniliophthora roreri MCA 2997]KAI3613613.1 extracellular triacylglycerol lipase precursor [Moniliophthora roreri]